MFSIKNIKNKTMGTHKNKYPNTREAANHYFRLFNVTDEEVYMTRLFLEKLGYDFNSDIPIWKQFELKHNIKGY